VEGLGTSPKKTVVGNRFEVLKNWVMQCGVREMRRQEVVERKVQYFRCGEEEHKKWECPKRMEERKRKQEKVPPPGVWKKVKGHCRVRGLSPRGAVMSMEG